MEARMRLEGAEKFRERIRKLLVKLKDLKPFFKAAGLIMLQSVDDQFKQGGNPSWLSLSPATLRRRRKKGAGAKPLLDTGLLRASVGNPSKLGLYELKPLSIAVGTNVPYAPPHQFGAKGIPARPFMVLTPKYEENIVDLADDFINQAAEGTA